MTTAEEIQELSKRIFALEKSPFLVDHQHTGFDSSRIAWIDIYEKKAYIPHMIVGTAAATAANYGVFFIVPFSCYLLKFQEVHQTAGTDAGTVTVTLEKLTGTQALDAGVEMLSTALSLKAAVNTVQTGTLTGTLANRNLAVGNRLAMKDSGTLTAVANVTASVELQLT